jgi:hypothetical protein
MTIKEGGEREREQKRYRWLEAWANRNSWRVHHDRVLWRDGELVILT